MKPLLAAAFVEASFHPFESAAHSKDLKSFFFPCHFVTPSDISSPYLAANKRPQQNMERVNVSKLRLYLCANCFSNALQAGALHYAAGPSLLKPNGDLSVHYFWQETEACEGADALPCSPSLLPPVPPAICKTNQSAAAAYKSAVRSRSRRL